MEAVEMSVKKEKKIKYKETIRTNVPGVSAVINHSVSRLSGYLVDARNNVPLDQNIRATIRVKTESQRGELEKMLIARMVTEYQKCTKPAAKVQLTDRPYTQAYLSLTEAERERLCPPTWQASRTRRQALAYYKNTMLPLLDQYGLEIGPLEAVQILEAMRKQALSNGNHKGNPVQTEGKVYQHAQEFNFLYQSMRLYCPDYALPAIELPVATNLKDVQTEQCKALPLEINIELAAVFRRCISNGLALGGILMQTGLVRTAEACAPHFGDILLYDDYAVYGVLWQSDGRVRVSSLKSVMSSRLILLPQYTVAALRERIQWLQSKGYTDEEIKGMPVVSTPCNPAVAAAPNELSAYVRRVLSALRPKTGYWQTVSTVMQLEPDMDTERIACSDPSAYVLRRNACSILCNHCGMDPDLVDALMGHKLQRHCKKNWRSWLKSPENWPIVARYYERLPLHPDYSAHPAFAPIVINGQDNVPDLYDMGETIYQFEADPNGKVMAIEVSVNTCECGEDLVIQSTSKDVDVITTAAQNDATMGRVLGIIPPRSYYEEIIQRVDAMDLTPFLPPYVVTKEDDQR